MKNKLTIALAGNPNSGKTTIFNSLTGARQHVGNYPGVTVEKVEGNLKYKGYDIDVIDLPGTYSLTAYSIDEIVARNFIIEEKPDVVIDIIDTTNVERNLYLSTQLMELNVPVVLAFNMYDLAQKQGLEINKDRLSELLSSPIVFTVATKKEGINELLDEAIKLAEGKVGESTVTYGNEIQEEMKKVQSVLVKDIDLIQRYPSKWLAIKLLEEDNNVIEKINESSNYKEILEQVEKSINHLKSVFGDTPGAVIADGRYGFISGACSEAIKRNFEVRHTVSDKIDKILLNKILGLPIFLGFMWLVFKFTFALSEPLAKLIETGQESLGTFIGSFFTKGSAVQSLIVDGVIGGVGGVLVFVPVIFLMFLALAVLEGTGYMARAAFIMDRFMHKVGLHGRSFIPMLLGFGCTVPAIMATRTIEDKSDRLTTILITPFMSCGARLPIYALFIGAFFPERLLGNILFSIYMIGIIMAFIVARIFRKYLLKGEASPFVMELPPYRVPALKGLVIHMWEKGKYYLKKAGTIILAGSILIWFLSNFPWNIEYSKDYDLLIKQAKSNEIVRRLKNERKFEKLEKSYVGRIGRTVSPVFKPVGFDDWRLSVGLIGGFVAKEIVVSTLGTLYAAGEESTELRKSIRQQKKPDGSYAYTPLTAYALMVFVLLYIPCLATIAVIKIETKSWKWPIFTVVYTTMVAWMASFIVYQGGKLIGLG